MHFHNILYFYNIYLMRKLMHKVSLLNLHLENYISYNYIALLFSIYFLTNQNSNDMHNLKR